MRNLRPKLIAIEALLCAVLLLAGSTAWAQVVGTVAHLSGPLVAKKPNGTVKVLAVKSEVENGDTLVSEKNTYAQIKFVDNGEITLRPNTTFKIEKFAYDAAKPDGDSASFDLVKGGLRSVTGLLGKRNKEKFALKTPSATIGIRGTTFIAHYVPPASSQAPGLPGMPPSPIGGVPDTQGQAGPVAQPPGTGAGPGPAAPPVLPPGLHLQVTDGAIVVTNNGGSQGFQAGQFGFVPSVNQPPVIVPSNPGIQFVPPPSFNAGSGGPAASSGPGPSQAVDCIVR
ncbi:FecR family protein [Massilia agilis]|uniref:FecR family protein n=1 Tax=Massilia agilis TaxID=1811226 RepID=A0ABT2D9S3_9BURK|nr:FecR family protein [Massilia agilis]MCS0807213.1 FecR family protein [Massilia agilis]